MNVKELAEIGVRRQQLRVRIAEAYLCKYGIYFKIRSLPPSNPVVQWVSPHMLVA